MTRSFAVFLCGTRTASANVWQLFACPGARRETAASSEGITALWVGLLPGSGGAPHGVRRGLRGVRRRRVRALAFNAFALPSSRHALSRSCHANPGLAAIISAKARKNSRRAPTTDRAACAPSHNWSPVVPRICPPPLLSCLPKSPGVGLRGNRVGSPNTHPIKYCTEASKLDDGACAARGEARVVDVCEAERDVDAHKAHRGVLAGRQHAHCILRQRGGEVLVHARPVWIHDDQVDVVVVENEVAVAVEAEEVAAVDPVRRAGGVERGQRSRRRRRSARCRSLWLRRAPVVNNSDHGGIVFALAGDEISKKQLHHHVRQTPGFQRNVYTARRLFFARQ